MDDYWQILVSNKALRILLITNALILASGAMLAPIYALFVEEIGGSLFDAGLTFSIYAFAAGIATLFSGKISDKVKENELIIVAGYLLVASGFVLYVFANSLPVLWVAQIIVGFGGAVYAPAFDGIYTAHIKKGREGKSWGLWEAMDSFITAIGALVGALIVTQFGFDTLFFIMAGLAAVSAAYVYVLPREVL